MAAIDTFININITESASTATTVTTTIPLLLGVTNPSWAEGDVVHAYTSASGMLTDGFSTTSPEYIAAVALTSQPTVPNEFLVGRRSGAGTAGEPEIDTITVGTVTGNHVYAFTINGKLYSYSSGAQDTAAIILQGLHDAVAADSAAVVTPTLTNTGATLTLTGNVDGQALNFTGVDSSLSKTTTQSSSAAEAATLATSDLVDIQAQNDSWYALVLVGAADSEVETAASWVQAQRKMLFSCISEGDTAATLKSGSFNRTCTMVSPASAATGIMAAWVGYQLPQTPGTNNWAMKSLQGQQPDTFSDATALSYAGNPIAGVNGLNTNIYTQMGGVGLTRFGQVASGDYIDNIIGIDWLYFNIQSSILNTLVSTPGKVPYTDTGVALLIAAVDSVLKTAADNDLVDRPSISVTAPKVATATKAMRASRRAPTISFSATLKGAVNAIVINGTVNI